MTYRRWSATWKPSSDDHGFPTYAERAGKQVTVTGKVTNVDLYDVEFEDGAYTRGFKKELVKDATDTPRRSRRTTRAGVSTTEEGTSDSA